MKARDFQFIRYLLLNEIDLPEEKCLEILNTEIEVFPGGEPDLIIDRGDKFVYYNPTSVTRFLFTILYTSLSKFISSEKLKDKLGLVLLARCKEYVYNDYDFNEFNGPPVLVSLDKLPIPSIILSEIIEPIVGKMDHRPVFLTACKFTDSCRIIDSFDKLNKFYDLPKQSLPYHDFPILLSNRRIYNSPARDADILWETLSLNLKDKIASKVIRNIFLNNDNALLDNMITVIYHIKGDSGFAIDFLDHLGCNVYLNRDEIQFSINKQIESFKRINMIKKADGWSHENQSSRVNKQWSQWSMLMGLIEKQLAPMRGSLWPATENLKPIEDERKNLLSAKTKEKGSGLVLEEMLEVARDIYDHNAKPGSLVETLLQKNRVFG